jgi:hypothetical protein
MDRVVVVTKPTQLDDLVREYLTEGAASFALESRGQSIAPYRREHEAYGEALAVLRRQIPNDLPVAVLGRQDLPNFLFRDNDLIIVCGPDGLFVNLAQFVGAQPVLTVNPDPRTITGVLMLHRPDEVGAAIAQLLLGRRRFDRLPFVKASLDGERTVWGVNDIFIGRSDQVSARYAIAFGGKRERHSSSGIIISTGVGSTGWMTSLAMMMVGLSTDGKAHRLANLPGPTSNELVFVVREPFPSPATGTSITTGRIVPGRPLVVHSEMPEGGRVFSDGIVERALDWNAGSTLTVTVGERFVRRVARA